MPGKRPVYAHLIGTDMCEADGHTIRGRSPALDICCYLIAQGYDPLRPLMAFRGVDLAHRVPTLAFGAVHGRLPEAVRDSN